MMSQFLFLYIRRNNIGIIKLKIYTKRLYQAIIISSRIILHRVLN